MYGMSDDGGAGEEGVWNFDVVACFVHGKMKELGGAAESCILLYGQRLREI